MQQNNRGCLAALFGLGGHNERPSSNRRSTVSARQAELPYRARADFLSETEASFYRVLVSHIDGRLLVFAKVNVADLLHVRDGTFAQRRADRSRIDRKHVDFVLCDPDTLQPRAAIELDDASHQQAKRIERDVFLDRAFDAAELPLIRFKARRSYTTSEFDEKLAILFGLQASHSVPELKIDTTAGAPRCPSCGLPMVLREAKRGPYVGGNFFGCPNYPRCKETVSLSELT